MLVAFSQESEIFQHFFLCSQSLYIDSFKNYLNASFSLPDPFALFFDTPAGGDPPAHCW